MAWTLLVADDSVTIRKVVELTFGDTDIRVCSAGSGETALELVRTRRPDLVLADVMMPGPDGYEICRRIKSSERPIPVLLLAGTFESFDSERARAAGADGHLLKPFESSALIDRVRELLSAVAAEATRSAEVQTGEAWALDEALTDLVAATSRHGSGSPPAPDPRVPILSPEALDALTRAVLERISTEIVRDVAREVVPRIAEQIVRERIRDLESEGS